MSQTNRLLVIFNTLLACILGLVLIQFAPSVANAGSTTVVACADKKTGALRMAYKKCSSKENNVRWGITGARGPAGAKGAAGSQGPAGSSTSGNGPGFVLRDATGAVVENVISVDLIQDGPLDSPAAVIFREGAQWGLDLRMGVIYPLNGGSNWYATDDCTGDLVAPIDLFVPNQSLWLGVAHKTSELARVGTIHQLISGECSPAVPPVVTSKYFQITPTTKPSDLPAPLYLGAD